MKPHEYHNLKGTIIVYSLIIFFLTLAGAFGLSHFLNITILPAILSLICLIAVLAIFRNGLVDLEVKLALAINAASGFITNFLLAIINNNHCLNRMVNNWLTSLSLILGLTSIIIVVRLTAGVDGRKKVAKFSLMVFLMLIAAECLINILC